MNAPTSISITPARVADLLAEGERVPKRGGFEAGAQPAFELV